MAVHFGAVRVIKHTQLTGQGGELGRAAPLLAPVNVGKGAGPVQRRKLRQARLDKRPVKAGVVGDHQISTFQHGQDPGFIQRLTAQHVVGDAGDDGDLRGHGHAGVFQAVIDLHRTHRLAGGQVYRDTQQRQLNHLVARGIEPGGFGVEHQQRSDRAGGRRKHQPGHQTAQHAVVRVRLQGAGHGFSAALGRSVGGICMGGRRRRADFFSRGLGRADGCRAWLFKAKTQLVAGNGARWFHKTLWIGLHPTLHPQGCRGVEVLRRYSEPI